MQTQTKMAIATMIDAASTLNRSLEVIKVNISSFPITPEPAQEMKHLSFTSQARDATGRFRSLACGLLPVVTALAAGCVTTLWWVLRTGGHQYGQTPQRASLTISRLPGPAGPAYGVLWELNASSNGRQRSAAELASH